MNKMGFVWFIINMGKIEAQNYNIYTAVMFVFLLTLWNV